MLDAYGRRIEYLRVSVTDRCNLRCFYCMPYKGVPEKFSHGDMMTYEEMTRAIGCATSLGFRKIRVTGGEPLVRKGLAGFLATLSQMEGISEVTLTTNGTLLEENLEGLWEAGVRRLNISLDTLKPERFSAITRGGDLETVWNGLRAALERGFSPVKLNTVAMRGLNDDEWESLANLSVEYPVHVRFIELMPLGSDLGTGSGARERWRQMFVPAAEVQDRIEKAGRLEPIHVVGNGPARYFRMPGALGTVGFISAMSCHFCSSCNRLRLTSNGRLNPCLAGDAEIDLLGAIRKGASDEEIKALIEDAVLKKPLEHHMTCGEGGRRLMSRLGG